MFHRFAKGTREVVTAAYTEAKRRGDHRLGTEHLLLGVLADPAYARLVGTDLEAARAALHELDVAAIRAVGIDPGDFQPTTPARWSGRPRFTAAGRDVLRRALRDAAQRGSRELDADHLLVALLGSPRPDPAAELLDQLRVDPAAIRARLRDAA
jgi:ATP-dependent Clp protease ATP-binding subunit ClpA